MTSADRLGATMPARAVLPTQGSLSGWSVYRHRCCAVGLMSGGATRVQASQRHGRSTTRPGCANPTVVDAGCSATPCGSDCACPLIRASRRSLRREVIFAELFVAIFLAIGAAGYHWLRHGLVTLPNCRVGMPRLSLRPSENRKAFPPAVFRCLQCEKRGAGSLSTRLAGRGHAQRQSIGGAKGGETRAGDAFDQRRQIPRVKAFISA
jgi:hypothetical protein